MCELFAMSSKQSKSVNSYLKEFFDHSLNHPHGWGLACIDGQQVNIEKEPIQAIKSQYLKYRLLSPVKGHIVLSHIRYATIGNLEYQNCHPYTFKDRFQTQWTLIHNGTIFDCPVLNQYVHKQEGSTDSERILLYIIDQMNQQKKKPHAKECFQLLNEIIVNISRGNKLNLILTNGDIVFVHTNYANTLYYLIEDDSILFSTQPLTHDNWLPVPMTTLFAYRGHQLLYTGDNHHHEYFENHENMKYLYQAFSEL